MLSQKSGIRLTVFGVLCLIAMVVVGFVWKMNQPVVMKKEQLQANGAIVLDTPRIFSDFELIDHLGQRFSKEQLEGKWSMVFFGFTQCPDFCPTTLSILNDTYDKLKESEKDKLQVVLVSLDSERDTVESLSEYIPYFNANFIGVTGNKHYIKRFASEVNIAYNRVYLDDDEYTIDHSTQILLINPKGDYHGFFKVPHTPEKLRQTWRSIAYVF